MVLICFMRDQESSVACSDEQNAGCSHLIVGGIMPVGDYYSPFAAQEIFHSDLVSSAYEIEIFEADHTAFSKSSIRS